MVATVVKRVIASSPKRDAIATWHAIRDLLTQNKSEDAKIEFDRVSGIAAAIIAERTPSESPIVVTSNGPQTRIYCIYDEEAIDGSDANEELFGFYPLNGEWKVSLPCSEEDLGWVRSSLEAHSVRFVARSLGEPESSEKASTNISGELTLNAERFLKS